MPRRWKLFLPIAIASLAVDLLTKFWARNSLPVVPAGCDIPEDLVAGRCHGTPVSVVDNFWEWRLAFNPGSAFGLFDDVGVARVLLSVVGILAVLAMGWMLHRARDSQRMLAWSLGLIAGGALGNVIERIYFGVVTDFFVLRYHERRWPTFNAADIALVVGVGLMFFAREKPSKKAAPS